MDKAQKCFNLGWYVVIESYWSCLILFVVSLLLQNVYHDLDWCEWMSNIMRKFCSLTLSLCYSNNFLFPTFDLVFYILCYISKFNGSKILWALLYRIALKLDKVILVICFLKLVNDLICILLFLVRDSLCYVFYWE